MNKLRFISLFLLVLMLFTSICVAETADPRADLYFNAATAFLASDKSVTFDLTTYDIHNKIHIISVWLQQKVDGEWEYVKTLTPPPYIARNTISYVYTMSYSSQIGSGTFRVGFTAYADGHTITRYSNSRTF